MDEYKDACGGSSYEHDMQNNYEDPNEEEGAIERSKDAAHDEVKMEDTICGSVV